MATIILVCCVGTFVISVPIAVAWAFHVGLVASVKGQCMQPLLNPGENDRDVVLLNRWSAKNYQIQRGDIVILSCPNRPGFKIGKRVIALEGDTIRTLRYKEPYVTVPPGHCWVESDNRQNSYDSNNHGPVSVGLFIAKMTHVVWPLRHWKRLITAVPSDRAPITEQDLLKLEERIGTPQLST